MIRWLENDSNSSSTSSMITTDISKQVDLMRRNKLSPIEEDYLFDYFFPEYGNHSTNQSKPVVSIIAQSERVGSVFVSKLLDEHVPEESRVSVFASQLEICHLEELLNSAFHSRTLSNIATYPVGGNRVLDVLTFIHLPVSVARKSLIDASATVLLVFDEDEPDLTDRFRRLLPKLISVGVQAKLRVVILTREADHSKLIPIVWSLSKLIDVPEMPKTYLLTREESGELKRNSSSEELFKDLIALPNKALLSQLVGMQAEAKMARSHALLMSHLKSQLPTFNRSAKQAKLVGDLESVIAGVAAKNGLGITDFPSADTLRGRLVSLDFNRIKKVKESSLILVNELLSNDIPKLLTVVPHSEEDMLMIQMTTASSKVSAGLSPQFSKPPIVSDYVNDFESLVPHNGFLEASPRLREHFLGISKLASASLYKIWKLADIDKDGKLSLREYAVCRELIKGVCAGGDIPRNLPPTFIV